VQLPFRPTRCPPVTIVFPVTILMEKRTGCCCRLPRPSLFPPLWCSLGPNSFPGNVPLTAPALGEKLCNFFSFPFSLRFRWFRCVVDQLSGVAALQRGAQYAVTVPFSAFPLSFWVPVYPPFLDWRCYVSDYPPETILADLFFQKGSPLRDFFSSSLPTSPLNLLPPPTGSQGACLQSSGPRYFFAFWLRSGTCLRVHEQSPRERRRVRKNVSSCLPPLSRFKPNSRFFFVFFCSCLLFHNLSFSPLA